MDETRHVVVPEKEKKGSLPVYLEPLPGEDLIAWRDRIRQTVARDALAKSYTYENAYGQRMLETAVRIAGMAEPDKLDVTARADTDWAKHLTTDELLSLNTLHQTALERSKRPTIPALQPPQSVNLDDSAIITVDSSTCESA